jgi:hypothetical protein
MFRESSSAKGRDACLLAQSETDRDEKNPGRKAGQDKDNKDEDALLSHTTVLGVNYYQSLTVNEV